MRLIVHSKGARVGEVACDQEAVFIGSDASCGVVLSDAGLPGRHSVVYPEGEDGWVLQPLEPENPLQLNGVEVLDKVQLRNNDQISIHDFVIKAVIDETAPRPARGPAHVSVAQMTRFVQAQLPIGAVLKKSEDALTLFPSHILRMG
ncbi:MAG: FHA domain-containing protein, partial [Planctomycetes bacterium]|nr:FHA domain-containing protein [Planctomycetota bacterium]